ncbi:Mth938-like domain-containing protein [Marilutibacter chinensis]|uniref:Mth938-like domain-containing protein n=1 Tax=Marilutibacter chinensis TaxID=2912247 RepID=A0ABS9HQE1_9GAMM|nr:Mth938-like domain-containing protein [Lysobacter chinensis]MCF7221155.1 Mth938-like domain-containing protein [Lysobacter chinensis]
MQLTLERPDHEFFLRGADGGSALVNERRLESSFVLAPDRLIEDWAVADIGALGAGELAPVLALKPEVVLLGTGETQVFPSAAAMAACLSQGIGVEVMSNAAAARTFNVLAGEGRRVVAAFVLAR